MDERQAPVGALPPPLGWAAGDVQLSAEALASRAAMERVAALELELHLAKQGWSATLANFTRGTSCGILMSKCMRSLLVQGKTQEPADGCGCAPLGQGRAYLIGDV